MSRRNPTLVAVFLAAVVVAGAGCGGGEDEVPASTRWAGDLCTAVNTWRDSISSVAASVTSNPSQAGLQEAADEATSATQTLVDDLRGLGTPETESGEQAQETLDDLAGSVDSSIATIEEAVDDAAGASGLLQAISTVSGTISAISAQLSSSLDELRGLQNVDEELRESFEDAPACDGLASSDS